jgi:predicted negative regulator of RcsB-dependent stress response
MADVASLDELQLADAAKMRRRVDACQAALRDVVTRGDGRMILVRDEALVAEFPSAVEAVRAAVDAQETLRVRNRSLPPEQRLDFRFGLTIADVPDGEGEVPGETLEAAARLVALAAPGGMCISRSVREAVASKLKLKFQDLAIANGAETPSLYRVASERPEPLADPPLRLAIRARYTLAALAIGGISALVGFVNFAGPRTDVPSRPHTDQRPPVTVYLPALPPGAPHAPPAKETAAKDGGGLEIKPAFAPDPSTVLTARRLLPKAWKECHDPSADVAVRGCKTLLDSNIAKGEELADVLFAQAKAERGRHDLDKALGSLTAAIAAAPSPAAYSLRGTVYYDKEKWEEAISDYSETIRRDPANGEAFNNRAWTYYRIGRADKALADAEAAVRLLAKEAYVWDTRGHINAELGNRDAAISDFRAALAIDPTNRDSKTGLARLGVD